MNTKFFHMLLSGIVVYGVLLATPVHGLTLKNLTSTGASIAASDAACPDQPYLRYVGGKPDNFNRPADRAYPSPDLVLFMTPSVQGIVDYDVPMDNGRFGDSFNLQNTRSVCYAVIEFRTKPTGGNASNDSPTIGHVGFPFTFTVAAQVRNLGNTTGIQSYAFDSAGRALRSDITGVFLDKTPLDSILDVYLQDDTMIDFIHLWVWYGPNCREVSPFPTC